MSEGWYNLMNDSSFMDEGDDVSAADLTGAGFSNVQSATIFDAMKGTRAMRQSMILLRAEMKKQQEEMKKIMDAIMILMLTVRAIEQAQRLLELAESTSYVEPWKIGIAVAALGVTSGLDIYYASRLTSGGV